MRISDWSSDVCSSDLSGNPAKRSAGRSEALVTEAEEWVHRDEMLERPERRDLVARLGDGSLDRGCLRAWSFAGYSDGASWTGLGGEGDSHGRTPPADVVAGERAPEPVGGLGHEWRTRRNGRERG